MMKHLILLFSFIILAMPAFAMTEKGSKIPHGLEALDQNGTVQNFESIKGQNGAILVFIRSADWCPFCQRQLLKLQDISDIVTQHHGYNIISISYDHVDALKKFSDESAIPFVMLSDPQSDIIKAFGIMNDAYEKDSRFYGIPHPHVYVVNAKGFVEHVLSEEGFRIRPSNEQILEVITTGR